MYRKYFKRILDFIISLIALIIFLPIIILISIAIKLETPGEILFKQNRLGKNGKVFKIYKFRTMVVGAENQGTGLSIRSLNDSRITKIGNILRKTSIDEIPQLLNVLRGDMSLIGPRPPVTYFPYDGIEKYPNTSLKRFQVLPGITGLAQIVYRNNVSWDQRFVLDVQYVESISFFKDLEILIKTIVKILKNDSVYGKEFLDD